MAENGDAPTAESLEQGIRQLAQAAPEVAAANLTAVANRAIIELHKIAREQSAQRRGSAEWGTWAKLANAARGSVLQVATVRDALKALRAQAASAALTPTEAGEAKQRPEATGAAGADQ